MEAKLIYTIPEVLEISRIGNTRIYCEIGARRLKVTKIGRRTLVTHDALIAWLRLCEQESNPQAQQEAA